MNEQPINPVLAFLEAMRSAGIVTDYTPQGTGKKERFHVEGDRPGSKNGFCVLYLDGLPAGYFGSWKTMQFENWAAISYEKMNKKEREANRIKMESAKKERETEAERLRGEAKKKAGKLWNAAGMVSAEHAYIKSKGINPYGGRQLGSQLIVPVCIDGDMTSLQLIQHDGSKKFLTGGKIAGGYTLIGEYAGTICIVEGYATGCSVHEATGHAVAIAFNAGNLELVAKALRVMYQDARLVLCADDDRLTEGNPGLSKAQTSALAVGGSLAVPDFTNCDLSANPSDFNDLHRLKGLEAIKQIIAASVPLEIEKDDSALLSRKATDPADPHKSSSKKKTSKTKPDHSKQDKQQADVLAKPHYRVDDSGVYFIGVREGSYLAPRWICVRLDVLAMVRDPSNHGWARLVSFADSDGNHHRVIIPMKLFKGEALDVAEMLLDRGLIMAPRARPLIVDYLQTQSSLKRARVTPRTGWHEKVFVLPDQAFGNEDEEWIFESEGTNPFKQLGDLDKWKNHVATLCRGNSRLLFVVSAAFAAPLLQITGAESGGFHLRGNSSDGKTTALRVGASVCGGADYVQPLRATDNGLEGQIYQRCDNTSFLDEIGQLDPKIAGEVVYMLSNGSGKTRGGRAGGTREGHKWRLLFVTAGEIGLAQHMNEGGKTPRAGQEARLADIPADAGAGLGLFGNLHGHKDGSEFSKVLCHAARTYYGTPLRVFLQRLIDERDNLPDTVQAEYKAFERKYLTDEASGQARRVAARFSLVGSAGEAATRFGITGWREGEAMQAAGICFKAWMVGRGGEGNQEEAAILAQVREFLERHGEARFTDWDRPVSKDDHAPRVMNKAGYRKHDDFGEKTEYFIYPEIFKTEVCKGFDHKTAAYLLIKLGYMAGEKTRPDAKKKLPGDGYRRVYHILPALWDDSDA